MCEILAISTKSKHNINSILDTFYKNSVYHPHGWGIGLFDEESQVLLKEAKPAVESAYLQRFLKRDLMYSQAFAHIRFATVGMIEQDNCHPFVKQDETGRTWSLIHNGTLFKEPEYIKAYKRFQIGDTDTERFLLYIVDQINQNLRKLERDLTGEERSKIINDIISKMADGNKLNFILFDGEQFYIHTNCAGQLCLGHTVDGYIISTTDLPIEEVFRWESFPMFRVLTVSNGEILSYGVDHQQEFIEDPDIKKYLYLKYANL